MSCDLEVTDCFGWVVRLDHSNWQKHIDKGRHLEVVPYRDRFAELLTDPDVVVEARRDGHYHFYRRGLTTGRFHAHYLHVVVEYYGADASGKVKSWWMTRSVDLEGIVRWMRLPPQ